MYDRPHRGGNRRRYRDDRDHHRHEVHETPEQILRKHILNFGEVDPIEEIPRLAKEIREFTPVSIPLLSEAFRIGITEQPYKIPYYAAILRVLYAPAEGEDAATSGSSSLGKQVLEDFWKGFQAYLDKLAWREIRLCIHFFAHLMVAQMISVESMSALLQSFAVVLDEFGVSYTRGRNAAVCAAEGLMISGGEFKKSSISNPYLTEIISTIQAYNESVSTSKVLVQPLAVLHSDSVAVEGADEYLDTAITVLKMLDSGEVPEAASEFLQPYLAFPDVDPAVSSPFELPSILVPPEVIELDGLATEAGEDAQVKKDDWPEYFLHIFDSTVSPDPLTIQGFLIRSNILDMTKAFEVNRKECARLLLEYPKWCVSGTFKPRPGAPEPEDDGTAKNWQLESTVIETILGALFLLPEASYKSIYYVSLITELCKLSPSTVGPAVGKSIRKLYTTLADGLDVDISRRFAEWFAVHMSNFGFQWVWKEWVPDLALNEQHPKRAFIRRAIEYEMRLSYHERILKTLPEAMQTDSAVIADQGPGPEFEFEDPANPHYDAAQSIIGLLRGRSKADEVIDHLDSLKNSMDDSSGDLDSVVRSLAIQCLLSIGSRSISHLLNAIERYLPLLRGLAGSATSSAPQPPGSGSVEAKRDLLNAASAFWKRNPQMVNIVFDKLMQYQIVDPSDVVQWVFVREGQKQCVLGPAWDLLRGAIDKANGRVVIARRKVAALRKEEDDSRARAKATDAGSMDVDADAAAAKADEPAADSPQLTTALKAFTILTREQKYALTHAIEGFVTCLAAGDAAARSQKIISESAWENRGSWGNEEWNTWETWGWYRHFCRTYAPYLRNYSTTLGTVGLLKIEGSTDTAAELAWKVWNIATGQI